jgi:hypothetical protein
MPPATDLTAIQELVKDIESLRIVGVKLMSPELLPLFTDSGISGLDLFNYRTAHVRERMSWRSKVLRDQSVKTLADGIRMAVKPFSHCEPSLTNILGAMAMGTVNQVDDVGGEARHLIPDVV